MTHFRESHCIKIEPGSAITDTETNTDTETYQRLDRPLGRKQTVTESVAPPGGGGEMLGIGGLQVPYETHRLMPSTSKGENPSGAVDILTSWNVIGPGQPVRICIELRAYSGKKLNQKC